MTSREMREELRAFDLPTSGRKTSLVALLEKARAWADAGATPRAERTREAAAERAMEDAARRAAEERRMERRERRGYADAERGRRGGGSVVETTRAVEAMKERGASEARREFVVQRAMSESGAGREGWFMLETAENREERAREMILALNGTKLTREQREPLVAWVPRVPRDNFYLTEEDAEGKSELELCQMVGEEDMAEMLQPGYVLVRCTLTQTLTDAFNDLWSVRGFATGGSSRFGKKSYEKLNQPLSMDDQIPRMIRKCVPVVKTDEQVKADEARVEVQEVARAGRQERDENDGDDLRPTSSSEVGAATSDRIEVHDGPFKGFKGFIVSENDDGSVEATLAIFGRDTNVTLTSDEYKCI